MAVTLRNFCLETFNVELYGFNPLLTHNLIVYYSDETYFNEETRTIYRIARDGIISLGPGTTLGSRSADAPATA